NITYLDHIVGTHADADHIGGLAGALNIAKIGTAYCSETAHDTRAFRSFVKYLNRQGKSITVPSCGDQFYLGSAEVTVVGPVSYGSEPNNRSIVLRIVYGNTSFLLTGDAEEEEEKEILYNTQELQSTVLKVGHHGSSASTSYRFLRAVSPSYAVISAGKDNTYGHPTEKTLSRLRDAEVEVYRTDLQGNIICTSDGDNVSFSVSKNTGIDTLAGAGPGQNNNSRTDNATDTADVEKPAGTAEEQDPVECTYILNKNTKKFHRPGCCSVSDMKEKNKKVFTGTRDEVIAQGYAPCKRCNP
ncbi:MAG: MBL fold metallo-hydrolase, partial [Lachnospiraceae bacterium]|nr:MBL fold metallo-hydrolase [Lachnospiraceae bacterium]